jgi:hypothetical protein
MTASGDLILYTRPGCHLCGHVESMLAQQGVVWRSIDIESDEGLQARYGLTIPVLRFEQTKKELLFPFGDEQLKRFLRGV